MSASRKAVRINPRRLTWDFSTTSARHWFDGSPALTHLLNVYTLLVPDNEAYYIRTLKPCIDHISDAGQQTELMQFFRQESLHGLAHKAYWPHLEQQGFKLNGFVRTVDTLLYRVFEPLQPHRLRVSIVAAIEHVNASLANIFLDKELLANADPKMRQLFNWHFAEEIEHKAVAHRVLSAVYPGYFTRILGAVIAIPTFYALLLAGMVYLLVQEDQLFKRKTLTDLIAFWFSRGVLKSSVFHIARYFNPEFDPWDIDDLHLTRSVLGKLPDRATVLTSSEVAA